MRSADSRWQRPILIWQRKRRNARTSFTSGDGRTKSHSTPSRNPCMLCHIIARKDQISRCWACSLIAVCKWETQWINWQVRCGGVLEACNARNASIQRWAWYSCTIQRRFHGCPSTCSIWRHCGGIAMLGVIHRAILGQGPQQFMKFFYREPNHNAKRPRFGTARTTNS